MHAPDSAVEALQKAARSSFTCVPDRLKSDARLLPLQKHCESGSLLGDAESLI